MDCTGNRGKLNPLLFILNKWPCPSAKVSLLRAVLLQVAYLPLSNELLFLLHSLADARLYLVKLPSQTQLVLDTFPQDQQVVKLQLLPSRYRWFRHSLVAPEPFFWLADFP